MGVMSVPEAFLKSKGVKNPQMIFWAVGAGLVVIAGIVIYRKLQIRFGGKSTIGKTYTELSDELSTVPVNSGNLTITSGDATIIAQNLLNAMDRWGTDEEAILDNLSRVKSKDDLNLVIKTFGIRPKSSTGLADTFLENYVEAVMKNLNGWLRDELSGGDLRAVKAIYDKYGVSF